MKSIIKHFEIIAFISSFFGLVLAAGGNPYSIILIVPGIVYMVKNDIKDQKSENTNC
jgi:hypothetical protein